MAYESYITSGLQGAQNYINSGSYQTYPQFIPSNQQAPTKMDYVSYTPTTPLQQIQAPNYQMGLMGGDYDALQKALYQPAETAANYAYQQGMNTLSDVMGGKGLYGSSVMGNQINAATKNYQDTLSTAAANAAAERYKLQEQAAEDQNKFNSTMFPNLTAQSLNTWKSNLVEQQNKSAYDVNKLTWDKTYEDAMRDWENKKAYEQYQYQLAKRSDYQAYLESMINRNLALAGQGAPLSNAATAAQKAQQDYAAAIQASQNALGAANTTGWLGLAGTLGGGLLSSGALSGLGSSIADLFRNNNTIDMGLFDVANNSSSIFG